MSSVPAWKSERHGRMEAVRTLLRPSSAQSQASRSSSRDSKRGGDSSPDASPIDAMMWTSPNSARSRSRPSNLYSAVRASPSFPLSRRTAASPSREVQVAAGRRKKQSRTAMQSYTTQATQTELTELKDAPSTGGMANQQLPTARIQLGAFGEVASMTAETVDFLIRVLEDRKQELLVNGEDRELHVKADYAVAVEDDDCASEETAPSPYRRCLPFESVNNTCADDGATVTELVRSHSYEALVQLEGILESRHHKLMNDGVLETSGAGNDRSPSTLHSSSGCTEAPFANQALLTDFTSEVNDTSSSSSILASSRSFPNLPSFKMTKTFQIPVVSIIPGIGEAVRQQLTSPAASSLASKLYQSSELEIVDLPVPVVCPPSASNNHQPQDAMGKNEPTTPSWKLDPTQQQIVEDAEIIFIDAHLAAPLLLDPKRNLPFEMQRLLKKIKWVQGTYAGVDSYHQFPEAPADPGFTVTRAGGIMPTALAQFVFGWVIALERKFFEVHAYQEKRVFGRWDLKYRSFRQVTIGILGLGEIGQEIGRAFKTSAFQVIGFKRRVTDESRKVLTSSADRVSSDVREVLEQSDYVVNVLPSTDSTRYLLTENTLEVCSKKKPVFINVGRGDVIAAGTIINALNKGLLSKAVLDVFEEEPLPKESPLWSHPKVVVTPHISGTVFPEDVADVFVKNLNRQLEGQSLLYQMDWSSGY
ncbi:hypothetical protein PHYBOEH_000558 [Phytophthora boehmeriae]|uniref:D-isomer specific 2-hydroxyacid dehydrogenase NAD-binding domain-containing protein n=1 Tax=Phytophthora boehmeriae TaxID=109152 RepID=A0A8T1WVD9_9STRA|nr:hypothetical protein PHYBOEH_000558 [Phytophthora boehmeriae]